MYSEVDRFNLKMQRVNEKLGIPGIQDPENGRYLLYTATLVPDDDDLVDLDEDEPESAV